VTTDLNDWRLVYGDVELKFGTYLSGFPFVSQVDVGTPAARLNDVDHPNTDGIVFGSDTAGSMTLTFEVGIPRVPDRRRRGDPDPWHASLDALEVFTAAWKARSHRRIPGWVAELVNDDRQRMVYGRPRNIKPKLVKSRQGWTDHVCDFATTDDVFYGAVAKSTRVGVVPAESAPLRWPIGFPWSTFGTTARTNVVDNAGTVDSWPVLTFRGPSGSPRVDLLNATGGVLWSVWAQGALAYDETMVVDTRPWARSVLVNGNPAMGRLRGSQVNDCVIPPGVSQVRYTASDPTGASTVTIDDRDAFASL
jgi:hypothetical protein